MIKIGILSFVCLFLISCDERKIDRVNDLNNKNELIVTFNGPYHPVKFLVYEDPVTKCQYFNTKNLTPRLNPDGTCYKSN